MANNRSYEFYQQPLTGTTIPNLYWVCGATNGFTPSSGLRLSVDLLLAVPFDQMRDVTASKIGIQVVTAGNAGAKCHLGIYENAGNTNNAPSGLVIDAGELDISSTGFKSLNIDQALTADTRYWAALLSNDGVAVVLTVAAGTSAKSIHWGAAEPFGVIQPVSAVNSSQNYGALPNTFPTAGLFLGGVNPMVALGFSAVI